MTQLTLFAPPTRPRRVVTAIDKRGYHLMKLERAREISGAICNAKFLDMELPLPEISWKKVRKALDGVSLEEMIEAVKISDAADPQVHPDGSRTFHIKPDHRLIAATYAFLYFDGEEQSDEGTYETVLSDGKKALLVISLEES